MILFLSAFFACSTEDNTNAENTENETEDTTQDSTWVPTGLGSGYFLDGNQPHSLLILEMDQITPPPTGETYVAYLLGNGIDDLALGSLDVTETTLSWETDIDLNALLYGYNQFEIRLESAQEVIYAGQIDPDIEDSYQNLLVSSSATPDGDGSVREMKQTLEALLALQEELLAIDGDVAALTNGVEKTVNTALVEDIDIDGDGNIDKLDAFIPLVGADLNNDDELDNLHNIVLADLTQVALDIAPTHPVRELANKAYDCTQLTGVYVQEAADHLRAIAQGLVQEEATIKERITNAKQSLQYAVDGFDANEDGVLDDGTEGAAQCALHYASQFATIEIEVVQ